MCRGKVVDACVLCSQRVERDIDAVERPVVFEGAIAIRRMMNLSSSFDHRFVDGYDAAAMIQALKECLEHPATIFIGG